MIIKLDDLLTLDFENYNLTFNELSTIFKLYKNQLREFQSKYIVKQNEYIEMKDKYAELKASYDKLDENFKELRILHYKKLTIKQRITGKL